MRPWRRAARRERVRETSKRQSNPIRVRVVGTRVYGFSSHSRTYRHVEIPFGRRGTATALDPLHTDRHRVLVAVILGKIKHVSARLGRLLRRRRARRELTQRSLWNLRERRVRARTHTHSRQYSHHAHAPHARRTTTRMRPKRARSRLNARGFAARLSSPRVSSHAPWPPSSPRLSLSLRSHTHAHARQSS